MFFKEIYGYYMASLWRTFWSIFIFKSVPRYEWPD